MMPDVLEKLSGWIKRRDSGALVSVDQTAQNLAALDDAIWEAGIGDGRLPDVGSDNPFSNSVAETAGFSLHAGSNCREDPVVIMKILAHLDDKTSSGVTALLPECRAPPLAELLEGF